ncbi:MAG: DUF378 domain-containing protein [Pygmaiobacter sp.]
MGGNVSMFARIVFTLVGLAALAAIPMLFHRSDSAPEIPGGLD